MRTVGIPPPGCVLAQTKNKLLNSSLYFFLAIWLRNHLMRTKGYAHMRLLLDKENRKLLFELLKEHHNVSSLELLAKTMSVSCPSVKNWRNGRFLIPSAVVPKSVLKKIHVLETKEDNWGKTKIKMIQKENPMFLRRTKMVKKIKQLSFISNCEFHNKIIELNIENITFSRYDKSRGIHIPKSMTPELAEEIGIHIGDGTLPANGNNYSSRGDIVEKDYYVCHVRPLYTKLFGVKPPVLERPPISGIEFDSKAIYEFKSKVLGLPTGDKKGRIGVPKQIIKSDNKAIFRALLRGITDTDGCYYMSTTKQYPRVAICILSRPLIRDLDFILKRLGFIPSTSFKSCTINIYGPVQFDKWIHEIGSKNPKHLKRIHRIKSLLPWKEITTSIGKTALVV